MSDAPRLTIAAFDPEVQKRVAENIVATFLRIRESSAATGEVMGRVLADLQKPRQSQAAPRLPEPRD